MTYTDEQKLEIHKRAKEMLARRAADEDMHAIWQAEHQEELEADRLDALLTRRTQTQNIIRKISIDKNQQGLEFILSDATPDRMGDIIEPNGWDITHFSKNPVALFSHDPLFVVGRWQDVGVRQKSLRGHLTLAPLGTSERIDEVIRLVEANLIRAVSVGFRPIESAPLPSGGLRFTKSELVECSLVSTPANPNALAVARSLNISDSTLRMCFDSRGSIDDVEPAETLLEVLADEVGIVTGRMERDFNKKIAALKAEIAKLKKAAK